MGFWPLRRTSQWYAQHGEDRRLVTLLGKRRSGFYIDVGAWDPEKDSVTKHFYDRGWRGINIEPHPLYHARLAAARRRDVNLSVALGDTPGTERIIIVGSTGLSTFEAPYAEFAEEWVKVNRPAPAAVDERPVEVTTLAAVCRTHVPPSTEIDFLKIDVEGWEERVLRGGDWERFRPRVLVVEAVEPLSDTPSWQRWDPFVREQRYDYLDFDGLNRWYRRSET